MQSYIQEAIAAHRRLLDAFEQNARTVLNSAAELLIGALRGGGRIYLCGNGGSAADAQHIAGELVGRFQRERAALPAVALTTDTSLLTALGNDYSYEDIFVRQVEALVGPGDVLWAFSTSGTSGNILKAARLARAREAHILAFTGRAGSPLEALSDVCLCADDPATARSQEIHELAYHILCGLVEQGMFNGD